MTIEDTFAEQSLDDLLNQHFAGKVIRKDLTRTLLKECHAPVYVLEYLLGIHCASNDDSVIDEGLKTVKTILSENCVRQDNADDIQSAIRERGNLKIIDKVTVRLNENRDVYEAELDNLGINRVEINRVTVRKFAKLLTGGVWSIITMQYFSEEGQTGSPFIIDDLKPIQMPSLNMEGLLEARRAFTEDQWIDVLLRSVGYEPTQFERRIKLHLLARMIPLVENNFNVCELGPNGTGKSHTYQAISPYSTLLSCGHTTVANLFYNTTNRTVGLVGLWDTVAFDDVAAISFKDKTGVPIMKDYMRSGTFNRDLDRVKAHASMVFLGNMSQSVDTLLKTSHLFASFPEAMIDAALLDHIHAYIPGWEIPKMRAECFTSQYGLIVDYLAEFMGEMRKRDFGSAINKYFKLGRDLNQRDSTAVKHTVSGLLKLLYPHEEYDKEAVRRCLDYAVESRRRVKEQLKKINDKEYNDVHFSYLDEEARDEKFISVLEQGVSKLIPDGPLNPGTLHVVATSRVRQLGLYRIETQVTPGHGKLSLSGLGSLKAAKESIKVGFDYFMANVSGVRASVKPNDYNFELHFVELHHTGPSTELTLAAFVALCSSVLRKPVLPQLAIIGSMSFNGTVSPVSKLTESVQVACDSGAKHLLLPVTSVGDMNTIPSELIAHFQTGFYSDPRDAALKAMGIKREAERK